jgi:OOP family OmpA-OmpF porin
MTQHARLLIGALLGASFCIPAYPQESRFYVGGALGQSTLKAWCDPTLVSCNDTDTAWKLFGGYWFNRYIAVEGSYIDWGGVTATSSAGVNVAADQQSYGIGAVGSLQISPQFTVFGKLGLLRTEQETRRIAPAPATVQRDDTEIHYGLGLKYSLTRSWSVRAEWENTDKLEVQMLSIGAEFTF